MSERNQLEDIVALLADALPTIAIIGEDRGPTTADVDAALSSRLTRQAGTLPGVTIFCGLSSEQPAAEAATAITYKRTFPVRVIENVQVNRPPGQALSTGYNHATAKVAIIERLHSRGVWGGELVYSGSEPLNMDDGRVGHTINFTLTGGYSSPARSARPLIDFAAGICTITGGVGAAVRYTIDGSTPFGDDATAYTVPFAVTSGVFVRASGKETGRAVSDFSGGLAP